MRMCIPTVDNQGQTSQICEHFGSAPYFIICDLDTGACETVSNSDGDHEHGTCHPMDSLRDKRIDCVVCRGLGRRALEKLRTSGIAVFRTDRAVVKDAVADLSAGKSEQIDPEDACRDHSCH